MKKIKSILNEIFACLIVAFVIITSVSIGINLSVDEKERYNIFKENNTFGISKSKIFPFNYLFPDRITLTAKYDSINSGSYPFFIVFVNGKCGVINKEGEELIPVIHDHITESSLSKAGGEFRICNDLKCGKIESYLLGFDYEGDYFKAVYLNRYKFKVKLNFTEIILEDGKKIYAKEVLPLNNYNSGSFFFIYDGIYRLYDFEQHIILPGSNNVFDKISYGCTGQTYVYKDKKWGVLNTKDLNVNIEPVYEKIEGCYELPANFAVCINNCDTVLRDIYTGDTINYCFSEPTFNLLGVKDTMINKWCFMDYKEGINITGFIYDSITPYTEIYEVLIDKYLLLAAVKKDEKWGWINEFGHTIIPFIYDGVEEFNYKYENVAKVQSGKEKFYIDIFRNKKDTSELNIFKYSGFKFIGNR